MLQRVALLTLVACILCAFYFGGLFDLLGDERRMSAALVDLGVWGPLLYVSAFALLEPFFVPGIAFVIPGSLVWPFPTLFLYSWLGSVGAGIVGFTFARYLARGYVERHLPKRLHAYDQRLIERGLRTVIIIRLTLFLWPPAHWMLGLSRVGFRPFVLGTAIGFLPGIALLAYGVVFVGATLGDWAAAQPRELWIALAVAAAMLIVLLRRRKRRHD